MTIDLDVLEGLLRDATSGVWRRDENSVWGACDPDDTTSYGMGLAVLDCRSSKPSWSTVPMDYEQSVANAELVVAAVNALPDLIAAAREREGLREAGRELSDALARYGFPVSGGAKTSLSDHGSNEAITLDRTAKAFRQALKQETQS